MTNTTTSQAVIDNPDTPLNVFSYVSLITFLVAIVFVIHPIRIPLFRRHDWYIPLNLATAPLIAILFLLATTSIHPDVVLSGLVGTPSLHPYSILILFYSIAYICISLDQTGFLQFTALWVLRRTGTKGRRIFLSFFLLTTLASALTSNDAVILTATPFLLHFTHAANVSPPSAFLMSEFVTANIASMALYIGNPTNVVIAQANSVTFLQYSAWMILPTLCCTILAYVVLRYILFANSRYIPPSIVVDGEIINPKAALNDQKGAIFGVLLLAACLITLMVTSVFDLPVWQITLPFAIISLGRDFWHDIWEAQKGKSMEITQDHRELGLDQGVGKGLGENNDDEKNETTRSSSTDSPSHPSDLVKTYSNPSSITATITSVNFENNIKEKQNDELKYQDSANTEAFSESGMAQRKLSEKSLHFENPQNTNGHITAGTSQCEESNKNRLAKRFPTVHNAFLRLPWNILPFSLGMFILVESLTATGWTSILATGLGYLAPSFSLAILSMGVISLLLCSLLNNLPATILLTRVLLHPSYAAAVSAHAISADSVQFDAIKTGAMFALVAGSNLGACLTISGSLAGIMWERILRYAGVKGMEPWRFLLWNLLIAPILILGACAVICAEVYVIFLKP